MCVITGVKVRRASSGDTKASGSLGVVGVGLVVNNPVWLERREWQAIDPRFMNANVVRRSVIVVLE